VFEYKVELISVFCNCEAKPIPFTGNGFIAIELKTNQELLNQLSKDKWELISAVTNGSLIYGYFKRKIKS